MDGNNSLSRLLRWSATSQDDENAPGPSCERNDTRDLSGDLYISRDDVDKWARDVVAQVQSASEGVIMICIASSSPEANIRRTGSRL